jgi:hypothetical protein
VGTWSSGLFLENLSSFVPPDTKSPSRSVLFSCPLDLLEKHPMLMRSWGGTACRPHDVQAPIWPNSPALFFALF